MRLVADEGEYSGHYDSGGLVTGTPLVSIIILNWNGFEDTVRCLDSLRHLTYPHFEVVLVDNGSSDGSSDRLPSALNGLPYRVEFVRTLQHTAPSPGGNVVALERCKGTFLALLNNDTVVDTNWLDPGPGRQDRRQSSNCGGRWEIPTSGIANIPRSIGPVPSTRTRISTRSWRTSTPGEVWSCPRMSTTY